MQTRWKSILDPVVALPLSSSVFLQSVVLASGANSVNHTLGRTPVGWILADINAAVTVYRSAAFDIKSLNLTASGPVTVNLVVF